MDRPCSTQGRNYECTQRSGVETSKKKGPLLIPTREPLSMKFRDSFNNWAWGNVGRLREKVVEILDILRLAFGNDVISLDFP
jgi:hypothetical protein